MAAEVEPVVQSDRVVVKIATSAQLSSAGYLNNRRLLAVEIPANTEGTAITFEGSFDGETFYDIYDADGAVSYDFTDPCVVAVAPEKFLAFPYIKVDTGTNQTGADATLTLIVG